MRRASTTPPPPLPILTNMTWLLQVTWQVKGAQYPLTVSTFSFLSNGKFSVEHDNDYEWNLRIEPVDVSHSGIYQCRVTTQTMLLVREIKLTVLGKHITHNTSESIMTDYFGFSILMPWHKPLLGVLRHDVSQPQHNVTLSTGFLSMFPVRLV